MESSAKTAVLSIVTNLLLVGIKTGVALLSGSLAIAADALHSLSDVVSAVVIFIGIKISGRSAKGFPYGLYKVENLVAMITSFLILLAGYEICTAVFFGPERPMPQHIPLSVAGVVLTIIIAWAFSRYELQKGRETGSPSLIADARHIVTDVLSSVIILTSLLGSAIGIALDKYAAVIVVIFIARSAILILLDSVRVLLDASLDYASLSRIREIVMADPRVAEINNMWARNAGRYKFVELDLTLKVKDLERGHQVSDEIENRVKKEIAHVDRVLIHSQPTIKDVEVIGIPLAADRQTISEHFGEAPYFGLYWFSRSKHEITEERMVRNPFLEEKKGKGIKVASWLLEYGLDVLISPYDHSGKGPGFVLGNGGAHILLTDKQNADHALAAVIREFGSVLIDNDLSSN